MNSNFYLAYLEHKIDFLEKQVSSIIDRYDKGGTLIVFDTYEEWLKKKKTKPTTPLLERNHPMI